MHAHKPYVLFLLLLLFLAACEYHSEEEIRMDEAEKIMDDFPDSAFLILRKIDVKRLSGESDRARYWLLTTMSKDKTDIPLSDDSLFSKYVAYFEKNGDPEKMAQAFYYNGVSLFQQKKYPASIVSYLRAYEIAERDSLAFWAAMSARGISDLYNETYSVKDELLYAEKELEWFMRDGRQPHLNYAICDYATSLTSNNEFETSIQHLNSLEDSLKKYPDPNLTYSVNQLRALNYIKTDRSSEAIPLLETNLKSEYASERDSALLATAFAKKGNPKRAEELFSPEKKDGLSRLAAFQIAKSKGDYEKAFKEQEDLLHVSDSLFLESIKINLSSSVADYKTFTSKILEERLWVSRILTAVIVISMTVVLGLLIAFFLNRYKKRKLELALATETALELKGRLIDSEERSEETEDVLKHILSSKYDLINELCSLIKEGGVSDAVRKKTFDRLGEVVNETILAPESISVLESEVDHISQGALKLLYETCPGIKKEDRMIFMLSLLNLSGSAIALLLKEDKVTSIYNRKRRLKAKILELPKDVQDKLLPYISRS